MTEASPGVSSPATLEVWLDVVGYEGAYLVSDRGRVYSELTKRVLRPGLAANGYLTVALKRRTYLVQHLVMRAFVGPRPCGHYVLHTDGDRRNNALSNLRYGTPTENAADAARHGTRVRGENYRSAKLNDAAAREIRALKGVVSQSQLAKRYGVSPSAIQAVHDGRTWTHA